MGPPSLWMKFRQVIGRALRETGQALDRVGIRGHLHATTTRFIGDDPCVYDDHLSRHRHQMPLLARGKPIVSPQVAYVAPNSTLIGSVRVGPGASIWYGAILRADACDNGTSFNRSDEEELNNIWKIPKKRRFDTDNVPGGGIFIGENSNVQDGCLVTARASHCVIGKGVTVGHLAQLHSATVHDHCLIGMGSIILEGVVVETESFVGAGAVVQPGTVIPSGELWVGNPAHKVRDLTEKERAKLHYQADEVRSQNDGVINLQTYAQHKFVCRAQRQYVKVAHGQRGVMELGGNLPESLIKYTMLGSANEFEEAVEKMPPKLQAVEVPKPAAAVSDIDPSDLPPLSPEVAAKLPPVKLPWEETFLTGEALRKHIADKKLNRFARQRLEAAQAERRKSKGPK